MKAAATTLSRIGVRIFRQAIKQFLDSEQIVAIGDDYNLRAFVVPVPAHQRWDTAARNKALRIARQNFNQLIAQEIKGENE